MGDYWSYTLLLSPTVLMCSCLSPWQWLTIPCPYLQIGVASETNDAHRTTDSLEGLCILTTLTIQSLHPRSLHPDMATCAEEARMISIPQCKSA